MYILNKYTLYFISLKLIHSSLQTESIITFGVLFNTDVLYGPCYR